MVGFYRKPIADAPKLGERLQKARQDKGLNLKEASKIARISDKYLRALEESQYQKLPGEVYARNFIKVYCGLLELDPAELLENFENEYRLCVKTGEHSIKDEKKPVARIARSHLIVAPRILKGIVVGLIVISCLVYIGFKIKGVLTPPLLEIGQPENNYVTRENFVDVIGRTESGAVLEINGQQVMADTKGNFKETIDLQSGMNLIEIKAEKRHGRVTKIFRQVVVDDKSSLEGEDNN